jgi:protein-tyrosine phosphatase
MQLNEKESQRRLNMEGTPNFRDFGGYPTTSGSRVKWGYLFRSGHLSLLTEGDVGLLASLDLDLIFDFRREEEQARDPNRLPKNGSVRTCSLPITPGSNDGFFAQEGIDHAQMFQFMVDINKDFAEAQSPTYAAMFREILAVDDASFLVHCAAGKDRTGFAVAVLLLALGVSRDVIMRDYMLTAEFFNPMSQAEQLRAKYDIDLEVQAFLPVLEVHEDYLAAAFASIDQRYACVDNYLEDELGVAGPDREELRRRYLG